MMVDRKKDGKNFLENQTINATSAMCRHGCVRTRKIMLKIADKKTESLI